MPRKPATGRHRITRRTKIATLGLGLALAVGALVVATTTGGTDTAGASEVDKSFFVDITKVPKGTNADQALQRQGARGTFTVDCGRNENQHFNPDNFIAQPGGRNGAEHLHDYVGNLSTNADSTNESLAKAGTTCKNGDKSTYFWPVIRIDTEEDEENAPAKDVSRDREQAKQEKAGTQVDCPDVASKLADVPDRAAAEVERNLDLLDNQVGEANARIARGDLKSEQDIRNAVLNPLGDKRKATLDRIATAVGRTGAEPEDLGGLAACALKKNGQGGLDNGGGNSNGRPAELPGVNDKNEIGDNEGEIQRAERADLTFTSGGARKVVAMPQFLRILYGDAKQSTNGPANVRPSWTCSGFEDRLVDKYPICPEGSKVTRIHSFPNCWDGKNIDSANHRSHIVFSDQQGRCPQGFRNVPQLRITLTYNIPRDVQVNGQYKVDAFEQENHNPRSDHDDFANVMGQRLMNQVVRCINSGQRCSQ
ncbi:DUF1996 domain-containing protein [Amycolatopsis sp. NPDC021455]|uniref:DUF1996 domain-containing protein n=1 Tax=Amycolatopsis sp. NPDC021455 TaxID=3154901 RepID=UPI00340CFDDD